MGLIGSMGMDLTLPGFPQMAHDFRTSASAVQLTLSSFTAGLAVGQLVFGPWSDRIGRRIPLIIGGAIGIVAGFGCWVAPNLAFLVGMRFLQAFGGSAGVVLGRVVITDVVHGDSAARLFNILTIVSTVAPVLSPVIGGLLQSTWGWRSNLLALLGLAAVSLGMILLLLPESLPPKRRGGSRTSSSSTAETMHGLARSRGFLDYGMATVCSFGSMMSFVSASSFLFETHLRLPVSSYSTTMALCALGMIALPALSARLIGRISVRWVTVAAGATQLCCSLILLVVVATNGLSYLVLVVPVILANGAAMTLMSNGMYLALNSLEGDGAKGLGSALIGALQYALTAVVSPVANLGGSPLSWILTQTLLALAAALFALHPRRHRPPALQKSPGSGNERSGITTTRRLMRTSDRRTIGRGMQG